VQRTETILARQQYADGRKLPDHHLFKKWW